MGRPLLTAFVIPICSAPCLLKFYLVENAPSNDLSAIKLAFNIKDQKPKLGQALIGFSPLMFLPFRNGEPKLSAILISTELNVLVGPQNWLLLKVAEIPDGEVQKWIKWEDINILTYSKPLKGRMHVSMTVSNATST